MNTFLYGIEMSQGIAFLIGMAYLFRYIRKYGFDDSERLRKTLFLALASFGTIVLNYLTR